MTWKKRFAIIGVLATAQVGLITVYQTMIRASQPAPAQTVTVARGARAADESAKSKPATPPEASEKPATKGTEPALDAQEFIPPVAAVTPVSANEAQTAPPPPGVGEVPPPVPVPTPSSEVPPLSQGLPPPPATSGVPPLPSVPSDVVPPSPGTVAPPTPPSVPPIPTPPVGAQATPANRNDEPSVPPSISRGDATSFNIKHYKCEPEDVDFATLSKKAYGSDRYSVALLAYNRDHPLIANQIKQDPPRLQPGMTVFVGSSRVDLQACKLEYSIVSPK